MPAPAAPSRRRTGPFALGTAVAALAVAVTAFAGDAPKPSARTDDVAEALRPVFASRCIACHDPKTKAGAFELPSVVASIGDEGLVRARLEAWRKIRARVAAGEMPPKDAPALEPAARATFLAAVDRVIATGLPPPLEGDPGRVTLRRLNRFEYRRTIRDLLGVDDRSSDGFPSDDVGHGFDRIGDVLSMPPLLLEKVAAAAERIAEAAIVDASGPGAPAKRIEAETLEAPKEGVHVEAGGINFYTDAAVVGELRLPRDGEYELRARAYGDQAGDAPASATIRVRTASGRRRGLSARSQLARSVWPRQRSAPTPSPRRTAYSKRTRTRSTSAIQVSIRTSSPKWAGAR